jgi:hypothetical protein
MFFLNRSLEQRSGIITDAYSVYGVGMSDYFIGGDSRGEAFMVAETSAAPRSTG